MYRFVVLLIVFGFGLATQPLPVFSQSPTDADAAATVAVELSVLEATADLNSLYDRIHPDARMEIPRAAVIGWFQNEFVPRGPGVSTVTGVNFVSWTWQVTGKTYPYTAEVSFTQPFADGTVVSDVVRLVQDRDGEWRWFFGRSREFVDQQIALYVPVMPVQTGSVSFLDEVMYDIDLYWATSFAAAGRPYVSPRVLWFEVTVSSACGPIEPVEMPAGYCAADQTIYLEPSFFLFIERELGDFASITILAHEWGHHVQALDGAYFGEGNRQELQADCLAGSYALNAETLGYLEPGDLLEAVSVSAVFGDPIWLPQDMKGAHGTGEERVTAFMRGYLDGFIGCEFMTPGAVNADPISRPERTPAVVDVAAVLPLASEVPADLVHSGDRNRDLATVVANYTNPSEVEALFVSWGWKENVTRSYDGTGSMSGVTSVYVSIHRLGSERDAVSALEYSLYDQMASTGAWEIPAVNLGGETRALETSSDVTLLVQQGDLLIRLTVTASSIEPKSVAESIMHSMLGRTGGSDSLPGLEMVAILREWDLLYVVA